MSKFDKVIFFRLLRYAKPYRWRLVLGSVFGLIFAGASVGFLPAIKKFFGQVFDLEEASLTQTLVVAGGFLLLGLGRGLGQFASKYYIHWVGNRVVTDVRVNVVSHLQDQSLCFFTTGRTGDILSRVVNDSQLIQRAVSTVIVDFVQQPFVLLGALGYLFYLDAKLAAGLMVLFPLCLVPVTYFGRRVRKFSKEGQSNLGDLVSLLQENVTGIRIVKAFGMENYERDRFKKAALRVFRKLMRVSIARASNEPFMVEISILGLCGVMFYVKAEAMPMNDFMVFMAAFFMMYEPIKKLSKLNLQIQQSSGAAERVFELLDADVKVKQKSDAVSFEDPVEAVAFENVNFSYDESDAVLSDIDLTVRNGECVAIVGSSGSGKTSLVSLLPRFYDVTSGQITLNGRDIRDFTLHSLRNQIGLVSQDTILFNDTVRNNIAYGDQSASQEEVEIAAKRAHAHEFILQMPEGYDTVIGERGVRLSGGQRQRLSIARAIMRNPPILILDEATSALDTESERHVQAALDELMENRTVFAIAHRLSTITRADRIIVLDQGRIVEKGTHQELLDKGGTYRYLYDLQFDH